MQESFELSPGEKKYKTMVTGFLSDVEALDYDSFSQVEIPKA